MSDENAISVKGISKSFKLPHEKSGSVKGALLGWRNRKRGYEMQHVLKDISFEIKKGEFFGIVGRNGSGKSTLLKLISQIYTPDKGTITVNGKLTPFIELGVGFNPELSGRDNVYLNGALMGFNREEMNAMYNEIVEFAELERFMDQKLKNYSSGMQVRLAFSIAIRANTDVLVLDEVLAVGDVNFQKKCFDYFAKLKKLKKTIVLVTHDMSAVERFCNRAILLDKSKLIAIGTPSSITQKYSDINFEQSAKNLEKDGQTKHKAGDVSIGAQVYGSQTKKRNIHANNDDKLIVEVEIKSKQPIDQAKVGIIINNSGNTPVFATNTNVDEINLNIKSNTPTKLRYTIDNIFANGTYDLAITLRNLDSTVTFYTNDAISSFVVGGRKHEYAIASPAYNIEIDQ